MQTVTDIAALQSQLDSWRNAGETIAFVPTMGNLHEGHLALVDEARRHADRCVVSIFVNPTQFSQGEDLASYPRTEQQDAAKLIQHHADLLFLPSVEVMYPAGEGIDQSCVPPATLTEQLCGLARPGHFAGVATVVKHLFELVKPDVAVFGEKDFQQLLVIRWLVAEHSFPVKIIGLATAREANGLAMSSRNRYLSESEREQAGILYQCLLETCEQIKIDQPASTAEFASLTTAAEERLRQSGFEPDYVSIRAAADLSEPESAEEWVILLAARLGKARLIDNLRCKNSK